MNQTVPLSQHRSGLFNRLRQFYALTKPRVVSLIVFCAVIAVIAVMPKPPKAVMTFRSA